MKPKNRIKNTQPALRTRSDVEAVLNDISLVTINRNRAHLAMDAEITAIKERHEASITECNKLLAEKTDLIRSWAEANPSEFGHAKSLDLFHAVIGWRTGQPQLKTLSGWTWDRVLEKLKSAGRHFYIRSKEEVNKQQIIADRELLTPEELRNLGVRVIQDESFFIDPKLTELENRSESAA